MATYCGTCGHYLDEPARRVGRCPQCGTLVNISSGTLGHGSDALAAMPTQTSASGGHAAFSSVDTHARNIDGGPAGLESHIWRGDGRRRDRQPRRISPVWAFALLSAVILLLAGAAIYAVAHRDPLSIVLAPFTSSNASSHSTSRDIAPASGTPTLQPPSQSPQPGAAAVPTSSASPGGSPAPSPVATPTSMPVPPILSVAPTAIRITACAGTLTTTQFTITNTGGTPFSWTASPSVSSYKLNPSSGSLGAGMYQTVTVSNILPSGIITIIAPTAQSSPQQVTITCTV